MKNVVKISLCLLIFFLCGVSYAHFGFMHHSMPWKITDPKDPRFDENEFRFQDYARKEELHEVLKFMFPLGTPKEKVDRILLENQSHNTPQKKWGAWAEQRKMHPRKNGEQNITYYYYQPYPNSLNKYIISAFYSKDNVVLALTDHGEALYNNNFWDSE